MIDLSKGIWDNGKYKHYYDGGWKAIVGNVKQEILDEISDLEVHNGVVPPPPTQEELDRQEEQTLLAYLASTDWYAIRLAETHIEMPAGVVEERAAARARISELRRRA